MASSTDDTALRAACVLAALRLRDALLDRSAVGYGAELQATIEGCLPEELRQNPSHSKVLCCASRADGSYAGFYRVDAEALARNEFKYGADLRFSVGAPGCWKVEGYEYRDPSWDPRQRPWLKRCGPAPGWSRPYADPATGDVLESFVAPVADRAVVIAGSFVVGARGAKRPAGRAWVELADPKMRSRLFYPNPVCLLTTWSRAEGAWAKNAMTVSWLTPLNNEGRLLLSINARRHSAAALLPGRAFGLSVPTSRMRSLVLAVGACSGRSTRKFDGGVEGLAALEEEAEMRATKGGFAALMSDSDDSDAAAPADGPPPPVFFVEGCCARVACVVTERLQAQGDPGHHVVNALVERAAVHEGYWTGKNFVAAPGESPYLTFLGSQTFGEVVPS